MLRTTLPAGTSFTLDVAARTVSDETNYDDSSKAVEIDVVPRRPTMSVLVPLDTRWFVVADDQDSLVLELTARDQAGNPIAGASANFTADVAGVEFAPARVQTNAAGKATTTVSAQNMGIATILATFDDGTAISMSSPLELRASALQFTETELVLGRGGTDALDLTVINTAATGNNIHIEVAGIPADWVQLTSTDLALAPGQYAGVRLSVSVPTGACDADGSYPFTVTAMGSQSGIIGSADLMLRVSSTPPALSSVLPAFDARVSSNRVLFSWRSNTPGNATVYLRPVGATTFMPYALSPDVLDPMLYTLVSPQPLAEGDYEWYGEMAGTCGSTTAGNDLQPRLLTVAPSVAFERRSYQFTVNDDYDQISDVDDLPMSVALRNDSDVAQTIFVDVNNPYADLILGFVGMGSVNQPITIPAGGSTTLPLRIFTQETTQDQYAFTITLQEVDGNPNDVHFTDSIPVSIQIRRPNLEDVEIILGTTDPVTLVTSAQIVNHGATITNLNLDLVDGAGIPANFMIEPDIHHAYLPGAGEGDNSIDISIIPLEILDDAGEPVTPANGPTIDHYELMSVAPAEMSYAPYNAASQIILPSFSLRLCYADECLTTPTDGQVTNSCFVDGTSPTVCDASGVHTVSANAWYCTNRPNIQISITLPFRNLPLENIGDVFLNAWFGSENHSYSHATNLSFNGQLVASAIIPDASTEGPLSIPVPASALLNGAQSITLDSNHPYDNSAHYIWTNQISVQVEVENYTRVECRPTSETALMASGARVCQASPNFEPANQTGQCIVLTRIASFPGNLRLAPSVDAATAGQILSNQNVIVLGQSNERVDGLLWYQVDISGITGWLREDLLWAVECELPVVNEMGTPLPPTEIPTATDTPDPTICYGTAAGASPTNVRHLFAQNGQINQPNTSPAPEVVYQIMPGTSVDPAVTTQVIVMSRYDAATPGDELDDWYVVKNDAEQWGWVKSGADIISLSPSLEASPCKMLPLYDILTGTAVPLPTRDPALPTLTPQPASYAPEAAELFAQAELLRLPSPFTSLAVDGTTLLDYMQGYGPNEFAYRNPSYYGLTNFIHSGLDFFGKDESNTENGSCNPVGTCIHVVSVCNGIIVAGRNANGGSAGENAGKGLAVRCTMSDGTLSNIVVTYNHLDPSASYPDIGSTVALGLPIGTSRAYQFYSCGSAHACERSAMGTSCTGDCVRTDPHIHMEVFYTTTGSITGQSLRINPSLLFSIDMQEILDQKTRLYYPYGEITNDGVKQYEWPAFDTSDGPINPPIYDGQFQGYYQMDNAPDTDLGIEGAQLDRFTATGERPPSPAGPSFFLRNDSGGIQLIENANVGQPNWIWDTGRIYSSVGELVTAMLDECEC